MAPFIIKIVHHRCLSRRLACSPLIAWQRRMALPRSKPLCTMHTRLSAQTAAAAMNCSPQSPKRAPWPRLRRSAQSRVIVPVLSSRTARTTWMRSRLSPPLIEMPCSAPLPIPTIMAVGVASPRAHGQATTSTATAATMAMDPGTLHPCHTSGMCASHRANNRPPSFVAHTCKSPR